MKLKGKKLIKLAGAAVAACLSVLLISDVSKADNPIIQNIYTADPAPMVSGDTLYVYTSHDEDKLIGNFYTMDDWKCYSTKDMVNWTDHGTVLSYWDFSWAKKNSAWAAQCVERDGKYYLYVPLNDTSGATVIGVAVGDSPTGPFEDPLDKPLIKGGSGNIDPTVFIDADGQAYMYWGNPDLKCVKLKDNMIETEGDIITWNFSGNNLSEDQIADMQKQFGVSNDPDRRPTLFEEAPWFYRRGDLYYMIYAANGIPERIDYSTSTSPLGPWTYRGMIMNDKYDGKGTGTFTNHPGIVDFKGHSYFFYHTGNLPGGGGNYHRSVAVEEFTYNEDGTIPEFPFTTEGVKAIDNLNPFQRVEAETLAWGSGLESEACSEGGINLCAIENEDYLKVKDVDFGSEGATDFTASVSSAIGDDQTEAGTIELHLDEKDGPLLGTLTVKGTGDWDTYAQYTTNVESVAGVHDLYMVFKGGEGELFKFDYWSFKEKTVPVETISLSASQLTILAGQSSQLTATVGPENATNKELTWTSSNEDVAIVAVDGKFTALKAGETTITAQSQDGTGIQASCHVVVTAPVVPSPTVTPVPSVVPTTPPTISTDKKTEVVLAKAKIKSLKKGKKNQAKLVIKKVKGATGYEVVYAKNKKFSKAKKLSTKKTSVTLKKLKKGTYYVKVRAYKTAVKGKKSYGSYSSLKKVKIK
ncbi:MAG: family 43 glycosylhydrolase [Eubacterium sp.]|nr:family 43 glycosylhydrolase [Eubacterium sp.]